MHHDLSFHVSNGSHSDAESSATHSYTIEHEHHHHELKVIAEMDPAVRGVDSWSKVQVPALGVIAYLSNLIDRKPVPKIARRFVARPPPDVLPQQLVTLRTQVLRL